jgi:branched-chain amino acid transport system permease protein
MTDQDPDLRAGLRDTIIPGEPGDPSPKIGRDEWVARAGERTHVGRLQELADRVPWPAGLGLAVLVIALLPAMTSNGYIIRVGTDTLLYILLAMGLNVAVGWAGLLDLGYVAFFGFGAYGYALMSSDKFGQHWPTYVTLPLLTVAAAGVGLALGLTSWRLAGDYLAIVTLFFAQIFTVILLNGNRVSLLGGVFGVEGHTDVTGGPNGIAGLDQLHIGGAAANTIRAYFWIALAVATVVFCLLMLLNDSRTGRAWRSLREDALAAELMSIPVDRLKLYAFSLGASVAGLTGAIFAALNTGVYPQTFDVPYLITIYAMVILGGAGSLWGVALGAIAVNVSLEALRPDTPFSSWTSDGRWLFYVVVAGVLLVRVRPWRLAGAVIGGTLAFGFAVHAIVGALWSRGTDGPVLSTSEGETTGAMASFVKQFVLLPSGTSDFGKWVFVALLVSVCGLVIVSWPRSTKLMLLPVVIYLGAVTWENLLIPQASVTRFLLLGALLVVLMAARPQGLLGSHRVEVV